MWSDISTYKTHRAGVGLMGSEVASLNRHSVSIWRVALSILLWDHRDTCETD